MSRVARSLTFGSNTPDPMWACECHRMDGKRGCGNTDYAFICYDDGDLLYWPYWSVIDVIPPGWYADDCLDTFFNQGFAMGVREWEAVAEECGRTWDKNLPLPKGPYYHCQCGECEEMVKPDKLLLYTGWEEEWDCSLWVQEWCFIKKFGYKPTEQPGFQLSLAEHLGRDNA